MMRLMSVVLVCLVGSSACGGSVATTNGDDSQSSADRTAEAAPPVRQLVPISLSEENSAQSGHSREWKDAVLRDSYYQCAKASDGSTWGIQACIEAEYVFQDGKLNRAYRKLMSGMDDVSQADLQREERKWISSRDASCHWDPRVEGQAQRLNANVCSLKMTATRADQLLSRLGDAEAR
jgi:uncharacterized protein YecT (DUF1311 family)